MGQEIPQNAEIRLNLMVSEEDGDLYPLLVARLQGVRRHHRTIVVRELLLRALQHEDRAPASMATAVVSKPPARQAPPKAEAAVAVAASASVEPPAPPAPVDDLANIDQETFDKMTLEEKLREIPMFEYGF
jgi:hypothetical protein